MSEIANTIIQNAGAAVGIIAAVGFIIILCIPKLRKKFEEYIILKADKPRLEKEIQDLRAEVVDNKATIKKLESIIEDQNKKISDLTTEVAELKIELRHCQAALAASTQNKKTSKTGSK